MCFSVFQRGAAEIVANLDLIGEVRSSLLSRTMDAVQIVFTYIIKKLIEALSFFTRCWCKTTKHEISCPDKRKIIKFVLTSNDEDKIYVCAVLCSKLNCTDEEKKNIIDQILDFGKDSLSDELKAKFMILKENTIPQYSEAPKEEQEKADKFLQNASHNWACALEAKEMQGN